MPYVSDHILTSSSNIFTLIPYRFQNQIASLNRSKKIKNTKQHRHQFINP